MAEKNDIRTLELGNGLTITNGVLRLTFTDEVLAYLGTTTERVASGKDKLVEKFDFSKKYEQNFIGVGKKV